jgi:hypothetical protein
MQDSVAAGERGGPQSAGGESVSGRRNSCDTPLLSRNRGLGGRLGRGVVGLGRPERKRTSTERSGGWGAPSRGRSVVAGPEGSAPRGASPPTAISANAWFVSVRWSGIALLGWRRSRMVVNRPVSRSYASPDTGMLGESCGWVPLSSTSRPRRSDCAGGRHRGRCRGAT